MTDFDALRLEAIVAVSRRIKLESVPEMVEIATEPYVRRIRELEAESTPADLCGSPVEFGE